MIVYIEVRLVYTVHCTIYTVQEHIEEQEQEHIQYIFTK